MNQLNFVEYRAEQDGKKMNNDELQNLTRRLISFRDERSWQQFHSLKELILSLNLEAGELLELTQWQSSDQFDTSIDDQKVKSRLEEECADVLAYLLLIAERAGFNIVQAAHEKIDKNELKYPVEKSKGRATKYNLL
jgi:NTP pyrophosphatase (non-canonical NTP hydrolase)